jgi:predicted dehydrogenase
MGARHARAIAQDPRSTLVWVHDVQRGRAEELARLRGAALDTDAPIDLVVVATPARTHREIAVRWLDLGAWCFVEKPLCGGTADALALADRKVIVGLIERFNPAIRAAGPLAPISVEILRENRPPDREIDVDAAIDLLVHDLDLCLGWCPDLEVRAARVLARGTADRPEALEAEVQGPGFRASIRASRVARTPRRLIRCYGPRRLTLDLLRGRAIEDGRPLPRATPDALTAQWSAVLDRVEGRPSLAADGRAGLAALALAEQIRETAGAA